MNAETDLRGRDRLSVRSHAEPGTRDSKSRKLLLICITASASVTDHTVASSLVAIRTSAGVKGRLPFRANGPSVSVNMRSRGISAANALPLSLRSIAGPTENQQSSDTADLN